MLLGARRRGELDLLEESRLPMRVWPSDLDLNLHLTNSRYLAMMDLGRLDWALRTGVAVAAWRRRWRPLVGSVALRFRRDLPPLQRFDLRTRLLGWDEKWLYLEQRFCRGDRAASVALVKLLLRGAQGNVAPVEVVEASGGDAHDPPEANPELVRWVEEHRL